MPVSSPPSLFSWQRHWWKIPAVATAAVAVWSLNLPLVQVPGMGEALTFMESGQLQGQVMKWTLAAGALAVLLGWVRLAGIAGGIATGLALSVACKQWQGLQDLKAMNEEMKASGSSMGDMSSMLDIRIMHGAWVLAVALGIFLLFCLWPCGRRVPLPPVE